MKNYFLQRAESKKNCGCRDKYQAIEDRQKMELRRKIFLKTRRKNYTKT